MNSVNAMAKLMTVVLIFSVVFISCGGEVITDTEPEGGTSPTAFSCNNDADCVLTSLTLATSTENCVCPGSGCEDAVNTEEAQRRIEANEEYCSDGCSIQVDCVPPCWSGTDFTGDPKARCVDNFCQTVCE